MKKEYKSAKPATNLQKLIRAIDKFWGHLNTGLTGIFRFLLVGLKVVVNAVTNVLGGFFAQMGQQETATAIYIACFSASIVFAIFQFGEVVATIFGVLNRMSESERGTIYAIGCAVGAFLNYSQLHSRLWRFKDTVAKLYSGLDPSADDGELDELTPAKVAANRVSLAFKRRERTTQTFYRIETLAYVLYVAVLLFRLSTGGVGSIALEFLKSLVALKLPELLLGLAEDSLALLVGQAKTSVADIPHPEDLGNDAHFPDASKARDTGAKYDSSPTAAGYSPKVKF